MHVESKKNLHDNNAMVEYTSETPQKDKRMNQYNSASNLHSQKIR